MPVNIAGSAGPTVEGAPVTASGHDYPISRVIEHAVAVKIDFVTVGGFQKPELN
jgi:hypothetical protein